MTSELMKMLIEKLGGVNMPNSQAPAHWSKDFVEHLRAVHFALIGISAGLVLLVSSSKQYNPVSALVQIEEIIDLKHQWSLGWITDHSDKSPLFVRPGAEQSSPGNAKAPMLYGSAANKLIVGVPVPVKFFVAEFAWNPKIPFPKKERRPYIVSCGVPSINWLKTGSDWSPDSFPRTLNDFRQWWNAMYSPQTLEIPEGVFYEAEHHDKFSFKILSEADPKISQGNIEMTLKGTLTDPRYAVHFGSMPVELRVQSAYVYQISQKTVTLTFKNLRQGVFEASFADLSFAAHEYADLPLEDIKDFVHYEAGKGQEVFEVFGMKFPAGQVTFWGVVLLLSVQLYFFAYLRQLAGKLKSSDPGWDVPWIGVDSSLLSNTILYATLVVAPCAAAFLLARQATIRLSSGYWEKADHWYRPIHLLAAPWHWHYTVLLKILLLILAAIASGYLGLQSWKYRPQIVPEPELPEYPAGLSKRWMRSR